MDHRPPPHLQPLLTELRQRFEEAFGDRLHRVVLYGSQARGDAHADSDIDILLVLEGDVRAGEAIRQAAPITAQLGVEHEQVIQTYPVSRMQYEAADEPTLFNARQDGISL